MAFIRKKRVNGNDYYYVVKKQRRSGMIEDAIHVYLGTLDDILSKMKTTSPSGNYHLNTINLGIAASLLFAEEQLGIRDITRKAVKKKIASIDTGTILQVLLHRIWGSINEKTQEFEKVISQNAFRSSLDSRRKIEISDLNRFIRSVRKRELKSILDALFLQLISKGEYERFDIASFPMHVPRDEPGLLYQGQSGIPSGHPIGQCITFLISNDFVPLSYNISKPDSTEKEEFIESKLELLNDVHKPVEDCEPVQTYHFDHMMGRIGYNGGHDRPFTLVGHPDFEGLLPIKYNEMDGWNVSNEAPTGLGIRYLTSILPSARDCHTIVVFEDPIEAETKRKWYHMTRKLLFETCESVNIELMTSKVDILTIEKKVKDLLGTFPWIFQSTIQYNVEDIGTGKKIELWINKSNEDRTLTSMNLNLLYCHGGCQDPQALIIKYHNHSIVERDFRYCRDRVDMFFKEIGLNSGGDETMKMFLSFLSLQYFRYILAILRLPDYSVQQLIKELSSINICFRLSKRLGSKDLYIEEMTPIQSRIFSRLCFDSYMGW